MIVKNVSVEITRLTEEEKNDLMDQFNLKTLHPVMIGPIMLGYGLVNLIKADYIPSSGWTLKIEIINQR